MLPAFFLFRKCRWYKEPNQNTSNGFVVIVTSSIIHFFEKELLNIKDEILFKNDYFSKKLMNLLQK